MGRTKTFDESKVLNQAMTVFWLHGYAGTTYALLELETGLTGRSLINTFGDKDAIFEKALAQYSTVINETAEHIFSSPSVDAIYNFFNNIAKAEKDDPKNFGCLLVNSIFEMGKLDSRAKQRILDFKLMLLERFKVSLQAEGVTDAEGKAQFLVNILWGIGADIRLARDVAVVKTTVHYLHQMLAMWQASKT